MKLIKEHISIILLSIMMVMIGVYQFTTTKEITKEIHAIHTIVSKHDSILRADPILNDKIEAYILKVNPKLTKDSARLIANATIIECNGDVQKISVALAIFQTETRFRHGAVSEKGAGGIGQTMPIALAEYKMRTKDSTINSKSLTGNIHLSIWTLENIKTNYVKRNYPDGIYAFYNGGVTQFSNLHNGKKLCKQTRDYIVRVKTAQANIIHILKA